MKVKIGSTIFDTDKEVIMIVLSKDEIEDISKLDTEGTQNVRYLKYPIDKYSKDDIKEFMILPEERIAIENKIKKDREKVRLVREEELRIKREEEEKEKEEFLKTPAEKKRDVEKTEVSTETIVDKDEDDEIESVGIIDKVKNRITRKNNDDDVAAAELTGEAPPEGNLPPAEREIPEVSKENELSLES